MLLPGVSATSFRAMMEAGEAEVARVLLPGVSATSFRTMMEAGEAEVARVLLPGISAFRQSVARRRRRPVPDQMIFLDISMGKG